MLIMTAWMFCLVQDCHSDADVKSALQAWCAYGEAGKPPAELFKRANPLEQAFALGGSKPARDTTGSKPDLGQQSLEEIQVPSAADLPVTIRDASHASQSGCCAGLSLLACRACCPQNQRQQ